MGSQLIEASEKQRPGAGGSGHNFAAKKCCKVLRGRQGELMLRRVPEMEAENQQLRTDLSQMPVDNCLVSARWRLAQQRRLLNVLKAVSKEGGRAGGSGGKSFEARGANAL